MATGFVNNLGIGFPLIGTYGGTGMNNGTFVLNIGANSSINQDVSTAGSPTFQQASAMNFIAGYATTATAGATTTLVAADVYQQYFTGATTQTVVLPVVSTLVLGQSFYIVNKSSGVVTVQASGGATVQAMAANTALLVTCILTSGVSAASWNAEYSAASAGVLSVTGTTNRITIGGTAQNPTVDVAATYVGQASITTVGALASGSLAAGFTPVTVPIGGTGASSFVAYAPVIGGTTTTGTLASASAGISNTGYVLTSTGASSAPTWQAPAAGLGFVSVAGTTQTVAAEMAYGLQNAGLVTATLDISGNWAVGQEAVIEGYGAGGFVVQLAAGQIAYGYNGINTTAAGTITTRDPLNATNAAVGCKLGVRYTATNTFFFWAYQGNFVTA